MLLPNPNQNLFPEEAGLESIPQVPARAYRLVGRLSLKILDSPMRNLFWLTFVPPLVPLRYCLVPTLPQW